MVSILSSASTSTSSEDGSDSSSGKIPSPAELSALVQRILSQGHAFKSEERRSSTRKIILALKSEQSGRATYPLDLLDAVVTALKTLGRSPDGTEDLASEEGLTLLLDLAHFKSATATTAPDGRDFLKEPLSHAACEALRCLANVCLLHEPARVRLAAVPGIPEAILRGGEQSTDLMNHFVISRLLFLITVSNSATISHLVENLHIAQYLSARLSDNLEDLCSTSSLTTSADTKLKSDIATEYLKVAFNVALFYPRIVAERKSSCASASASKGKSSSNSKRSNGTAIDGRTAGKSNSTTSKLQPRKSPSSSSSHPSSPEMDRKSSAGSTSSDGGVTGTSPKSTTSATSSNSSSSTNGRKSPSTGRSTTEKIKGMFSRNSSSRERGKEEEKQKISSIPMPMKKKKSVDVMFADDADVLKDWNFEELVSVLTQLLLCLPYGTGPDCGPFGLHKHALNALINYSLPTYGSIVFAPLSPELAPPIPELPHTSPSRSPPSLAPLPARLLTLLDACCACYIPGTSGPDDDEAREKALAAPGVLDESLQILILFLTKCAVEESSGDLRRKMKECLLADDIDRTIGLEKRSDLTGRLIRLMNSAYLSASAEAASKFLFAICDQNPSTLVAAIGYGNASGFLQSINMLIPPVDTSDHDTSAPSTTSSGKSINPITGTYENSSSHLDKAMTDEEKEREAERLFVLFDRMNRNPAMSVVNPVAQAQQTGKLTSTAQDDEIERKKLQEQEDEEERQALEEMKRYKERKNRFGNGTT